MINDKPVTCTTDFDDIFDEIFNTGQFSSSSISKTLVVESRIVNNSLKEFESHCLKKGFYFKQKIIKENLIEISVSTKQF
ncbi:hypothetical protein [Acinetobacter bereziniae]|uniref:hypothetical protein n=1 Tax=Acinetobacter bereziniae TaxID=106648 RepID=UPI003215B1D7